MLSSYNNGAIPNMPIFQVQHFHQIFNKWKNYFYEIKGDVGMSRHEKEKEQEDTYVYQDRKTFITPLLPEQQTISERR